MNRFRSRYCAKGQELSYATGGSLGDEKHTVVFCVKGTGIAGGISPVDAVW